jgi:hypothetical protein
MDKVQKAWSIKLPTVFSDIYLAYFKMQAIKYALVEVFHIEFQ